MLVLVAACDTPHPTPSPSPALTPAASQAVTASPRPTLGEPAVHQPSAAELIEAGVRDGVIDRVTGFLYRFYAQWGDVRLPEAYRGAWSEDGDVALLAEEALGSFTPDEQERLRPFLVRPTNPDSYWSDAAVNGAVRAQGARLSALNVAPACVDLWARFDMPALPVTIWGRCRVDANGAATNALAGSVDQVAGFMTDLWTPMTNLMGKPIGDKFLAGAQGVLEPDEAGDGRLDIYVVETPSVSYLRKVTNDALAVTRVAAPFHQGTSSAYMVVDPTRAGSAAIFKSTVAHEFFHVLGDSYNATGKFSCQYPKPAGPCASDSKASHWFSEASATWAEHHFVPEARDTEIYDARFRYFLPGARSLSETQEANQYESFMWPLFMEQESANGDRIIADTWKALKGKSTWADIQAAVDAQLPFKDHFRDFAVRVWNEKLEPGDPIKPRFQALDPGFPTTPPYLISPAARYRTPPTILNPFFQTTYPFTEDLPDLWASYYDLSVDSAAKRLTFDFGGLQPNAELDVDALVKIRDVGWERRKLSLPVSRWCLDLPADAIEQVILVLSNHSMQPNNHVKGDWTVKAEPNGCTGVTGSVTYTELNRVQGDDGSFGEKRISMTVNVSLAPAGPDTPGLYEDAGSSWSATITSSSLVHGVADCEMTSQGLGTGGGAFEPDAIGASMSQQDDGTWTGGVSASAMVTVTSTTNDCVQTYSQMQDLGVALGPCEGLEVGVGSASRSFRLDCTFTSPDGLYATSVTGTVTFRL